MKTGRILLCKSRNNYGKKNPVKVARNRGRTLVGEDVDDFGDERLGAFGAVAHQGQQMRRVHAHGPHRRVDQPQHRTLHLGAFEIVASTPENGSRLNRTTRKPKTIEKEWKEIQRPGRKAEVKESSTTTLQGPKN